MEPTTSTANRMAYSVALTAASSSRNDRPLCRLKNDWKRTGHSLSPGWDFAPVPHGAVHGKHAGPHGLNAQTYDLPAREQPQPHTFFALVAATYARLCVMSQDTGRTGSSLELKNHGLHGRWNSYGRRAVLYPGCSGDRARGCSGERACRGQGRTGRSRLDRDALRVLRRLYAHLSEPQGDRLRRVLPALPTGGTHPDRIGRDKPPHLSSHLTRSSHGVAPRVQTDRVPRRQVTRPAAFPRPKEDPRDSKARRPRGIAAWCRRAWVVPRLRRGPRS